MSFQSFSFLAFLACTVLVCLALARRSRPAAVAALELAFENMSMKDRNDTQPYVDKLKQLEEDIDKYIEKDKSGTV